MMTNAAPTMRLLLLKAEGQFKHSGKHYLLNGRWHALHHDKPVPKGAPIAAHPQAAGQHLPATLSADEVEALKYPADKAAGNHEMKNWNEKHLPELLGHAANGDATAILGMSFGVNTHGKKKALVANHLLSKMGSKHVVKPGQKAGEHEAVQGAPADTAQVEAPEQGPKDGDTKEGANSQLVFKDGRWHKQEAAKPADPFPTFADHDAADAASDGNPEDAAPAAETAALAMPAFSGGTVGQSVIDYYEGVAQKVLSLANAGDVAALEQMKQDGLKPNKKGKVSNTWAGKTPNSKTLLALHAEAMQHAGKAAAVQHLEQDQKQGDIPAAEKKEDAELVAEIKDKPPAAAVAAAVEHLKGDKDQGDLPAAEKNEDAALVQKLEAAQGPAKKGDVFELDSQYEKMNAGKWTVYNVSPDGELIYMHKVGAKVPNQSNSATIPAATLKEAIDKGTAKFLKAAQSKPHELDLSEYKTGAWAPTLSSKAFKGDNPAWYSQQSGSAIQVAGTMKFEGQPPSEHAQKALAEFKAAKAAGYELHNYKTAGLQHAYVFEKDGKILTKEGMAALVAGNQNPIKNETPATATVSEQPAAAEPAPIKKEPRLVIPKKAPEVAPSIAAAAPSTEQPAPNTGAAAKLDKIPWDSLMLPDSNKNAKSHNKQVEKIKALAMAGDVAGLEAFKAGSNTYGKKQNLLAQTALAALKEGGAPTAAPAPATSAAPSLAGKPAYDHLAHELKNGGFADTAAKEWEAANPGAWDELNEALTAHGYEHLATFGPVVSKPDDSPKEGDTKHGADGMLVFQGGRWHKQGYLSADDEFNLINWLNNGMPDKGAGKAMAGLWSDLTTDQKAALQDKATAKSAQNKAEIAGESVAAAPATIKKLSASEVANIGKVFKTAAGNKAKIKAFAVAGDMDGLKNFISTVGPKMPASKKLAETVLAAMEAAPEVPVGKPKKASKPKAAPAPQPAPTATAPAIESMDAWQQTGPQGGSNPGGRFKDANGEEWYCKFPADEDTAKAEVLAAKLYAALGISGQDAKLVTKGGKVGIASKWTTVSKASSPAALAKVDGVAAGFGADAWLGNWDVVGMAYDNLQIGADGKAHRVDAGGSLMYRAQGGKKAFGSSVIEIDSLRDPKINPQAAAVFGGLTEADITASVAKVLALPDASIRAICYQHGPGSEADRKALAETLIARKNDLAAKFPKAAKPKKKRLDPNNLPVDPSQLPKRHDFSNWNGPGKGLSSKPHVNAANASVEQEVIELAKTGNLTKLKDFHSHEIDKETGTATGKMIPIKNHPSKHVVQFHADVVQLLDEIANPPEPLKIFAETDVPTLDALAAAFPPKPFGTTVDSVKSNEKLGFWVVLGGASGVEKFKPKKVMDYTSAAVAAAHQKYKDAKPLAKHFINSVQASGSYNDLFRNGKETDGHGNKLTDVAKAALEQATEMPEGTSLYRWQNMSDDMVKKIMSAPDGTVFQATGPMCTSYSSTATSGFGQHRVTIRYAKGAKGVESFGSGAFKGEKEVTTLPNSRFVILGKKMVPNEKNPGKQRLELEVLMLPPDLGIADAIM